MHLEVCGVSHKKAPVDVRERISFPPHLLDAGLKALKGFDSVAECAILSTCNRVEIYAVRKNAFPAKNLESFFSKFHHVAQKEFAPYFYRDESRAAVTHLFRVAAGLDSMLIGESQILGQVKRAYQEACHLGCVGRVLAEVFEGALRMGKSARNSTDIGKGAVSIGSLSIDLAKKIFSLLEDRTVLVIGAGKTGERVLERLVEEGISRIMIANRTYETARDMAARFDASAVRFDSLCERLGEADIVISSTSSSSFILRKEDVQVPIARRGGRPIFLIDLAVPRDIDPAIGAIPGVRLCNIDDFSRVRDVTVNERFKAVGEVEKIIEMGVEQLFSSERFPAHGALAAV
ncbi:MAG: glutamyl-tRNA reductase [Candidatus Aureabacteria bacterium]|nr:glutamyl-tRNA reductase [Candidatus Auribacterota bacterium]